MKKILQIGEGNFLRAFAENYIQDAVDDGYDGCVVICQPRSNNKTINALKAQDCKYNILVRGRYNGSIVDDVKRINCVSEAIDTVFEYNKLNNLFCSKDLKIVISNTTEAGICFDETDKMNEVPNKTFPAGVTNLLYERYLSNQPGIVFLPVELIENNGDEFKKCVIKYAKLWNLPKSFINYVECDCSFCNTLVDRIVTGHISDDSDPCSVACEPYRSWIVQADEKAKAVIPFKNVTLTDNLTPFRIRKVRILNGAHTMSVLAAYLSGFDIVRDVMNDKIFASYINQGLNEIKQTINLPKEELDSFSHSVTERFNNPFIEHKLLDISLNSVSKFRVRCLDSIFDYIKINGTLPVILTFSLAALIAFYTRKGSERVYEIKDNSEVIEFFNSVILQGNEILIHKTLSNKVFWGRNITEIPDFEDAVLNYYNLICDKGMLNAVKEVVYE